MGNKGIIQISIKGELIPEHMPNLVVPFSCEIFFFFNFEVLRVYIHTFIHGRNDQLFAYLSNSYLFSFPIIPKKGRETCCCQS